MRLKVGSEWERPACQYTNYVLYTEKTLTCYTAMQV